MNLPKDVLEVIDILERAGYDSYIVGGAVRDMLMGREPLDYDIATRAKPEDVIRLFSKLGWKVVPKGIQYGVVSVVHPVTRREIEIASFRKEYYPLDYKRKNVIVEYAKSIEEDLARRDFTINAMAYSPERGLVDPFGGRRDLQAGIIRFVGEPKERIREDPLRMLRAVRFAAKYGFQLEPETFEAIKEEHEKLQHISRERIGEEVVKAMKGVKPYTFPRLLYETQLYKIVLPELADMAATRHDTRHTHYGEDVLTHTEDVMRRMTLVANKPLLRLASMLHDVGKPYTVQVSGERIMFPEHEKVGASIAKERMLETWRRPGVEANYVSSIVEHHMKPLAMSTSGLTREEIARRMAARYKPLALDLAIHAYADTGEEYWLDIAEKIRELQSAHPEPLVTGYDILALGVKPGPLVGKLKKLAYELQMKGYTREQILDIIRNIIKTRKKVEA